MSRSQELLQQVLRMGIEHSFTIFKLKEKCNLNVGSCSLRKRRVDFLVFRNDEKDCQSRSHPSCIGRGQRGTSWSGHSQMPLLFSPAALAVTHSPDQSGILEDVSVPCSCANARQSEHPHHSLAPGTPWEGPDRALPSLKASCIMPSPPTVSREAPSTEHTLPEEQTNFNIYISSRKALVHLEE